ncbi:DUF6492 family protein [Alteromonas sp. C1M14]|uniref:DUF6492 family protein n=1 Tax=Alteromonas sp. C1M14 TaxID=2841567 RepID=UPI001C09B49C|nr:DUF6492 family protein [Alteromonas sp. C1M14]MBU2979302.1 hypothetical protein [Alteromonas sp. C1M14]
MSLSAVLPLRAEGSYNVNDLGRAAILFKTLMAFNATEVLKEILVICPDNEVDIIQAQLQPWEKLAIRVLSEDAVLPELAHHPKVRGWRKQQLIKLGAYKYVQTPYYLTLDADAICLRPLTTSLLLPDNKALIQYEDRALHPKWWKSSARILKMSDKVGDSSVGMSVTPAIMARDISEATTQEIAANLRGKGSWVDKMCRLHNPTSPSNWTLYRQRRGRWTEYSLYYLCAQKLGLLDKYHVTANSAAYPQQLLIHDSHPFEQWVPQQSFSPNGTGLFCVVNSSMRIDTDTVWEKISPFVPSV